MTVSKRNRGAEDTVPYIVWRDYYSVGDDTLDAQHKQIIGLVNKLYEAMQEGADRAVIKPILDQLVQYTIAHFRHEEGILQARAYPDLAEHKAAHDKMRRTTMAWRDNTSILTGRDLLIFLKEWWCDHIQGEDKKYKPYVERLVKA